MINNKQIAVVIPAYRVRSKIVDVVNSMEDYVDYIVVIDDKCPEKSGAYLHSQIQDERLEIIYHEINKGVGGAMKTGFHKVLDLGADIVVKVDGDGQMDTAFIPTLIQPILENKADFTKGNRFYNPRYIKQMPALRLFGNSCLSLVNKFVTGYWSIMDPTNGFIAVNSNKLAVIEFDKLSDRYFFESDLLFRLSLQSAVVTDIPMPAKYDDENSSLNIGKVIVTFIPKYIKRYIKRIAYLYFIRDFNAGTIQLFFGVLLWLFGFLFGGYHWYLSLKYGHPASLGTIMVAALPVILGFQLLLGFLLYDINNQPKKTS